MRNSRDLRALLELAGVKDRQYGALDGQRLFVCGDARADTTVTRKAEGPSPRQPAPTRAASKRIASSQPVTMRPVVAGSQLQLRLVPIGNELRIDNER